MSWTPRVTSPSTDNLYYIVTSYGGYNECIEIADGSALPNCVGYAWGRIYEGNGTRPNLSRGDANGWYSYPDGYARGTEPRTGAVICYSGVDGHVAVVEHVYDNGDIFISSSSYGGYRFNTFYLHKSDNYYLEAGLTFQGFIYCTEYQPIIDVTRKRKFPWSLYARKLRNKHIF